MIIVLRVVVDWIAEKGWRRVMDLGMSKRDSEMMDWLQTSNKVDELRSENNILREKISRLSSNHIENLRIIRDSLIGRVKVGSEMPDKCVINPYEAIDRTLDVIGSFINLLEKK